MRKITSSAFILVLLLLSLWGLSTWFFAGKNKATIQYFSTALDEKLPEFITYQVLDLNHSVISTNAQYSLSNSSDNFFSDIWSALDNQFIINFEIFNGPLLLDKSGVEIGNSAWKVSLDKNNNELLNNLKLKQLPVAIFRSSFDKKIYYELPIQSLIGNLKINGIYDSLTAEGFGEIQISNILFKDIKNSLKVNQASIKYKHFSDASEQFQLDLISDIPEFLYQHTVMKEYANLQLSGISKILIKNQKLNVSNNININHKTSTLYPVDKSEFNLKITELDLVKVSDLMDKMNQSENLNEQIKWILEEQGELPEGQDQIWQRQDNIEQISAVLPLLVKQLILKNEKPLADFTIITEYENRDSTLKGSIVPISERVFNSISSSSNATLFSLVQAKADVKLDKTLLDYISTLLPISNNQFKLTYKDNRLIMQ